MLTKALIVITCGLGSAMIASMFHSAHNVVFSLLGVPFTGVLLVGLFMAGLAMRVKVK